MNRVRIVGGGLAGILSALEAHRLGARDIEICERGEELGGGLFPRTLRGVELRERPFLFGGPDNPARRALEWAGAGFQDVQACWGSASPTPRGGAPIIEDAPGPVLNPREPARPRRGGDSLADRLRAFPADIEAPLARYCQWRLGVWLDEAHESCADLLGLELMEDAAASSSSFSTPRGGFTEMFRSCRRGLEGLGVQVRTGVAIAPREVLAAPGGETVVWACDPMGLYPALDIQPPKRLAPRVATYVFKARFAGVTPFIFRNFTAAGAVFAVHAYETRGDILASIQCVSEVAELDLRREVAALTAGLGAEPLALGELLWSEVRAEDRPSVEGRRKLKALRHRLTSRLGPRFVAAGWERRRLGERFAEIQQALAEALTPAAVAARASAAA